MKILVPEPFVNVLEVSLVIPLFVAMTILAQWILVEPMLIVKLKEIELFADVVKVMKVIPSSNAP